MASSGKKRRIRLERRPGKDGIGVFSIEERKRKMMYTFREIPNDLGGRGFAVHNIDRNEFYDVRIGAREQCSCECRGFLRWGHCKHITGLLALAERKLL